MLELRGLNEKVKNEDIKRIIGNHYHSIIVDITGFIGALVDEGARKINKDWSDSFVAKIRDDICPAFVKDEEKQIELIKSSFNKLYAPDVKKTTAEENYVLARAVSFGIVSEELFMKNLVDRESYEELDEWLNSYKIKNDKDRKKIESYIRALGKDEPYDYRDYLEEIGGDFEKYIKDHWKNSPVIEYENPNSSITLLFSKDELTLLSAVQPEKELPKQI